MNLFHTVGFLSLAQQKKPEYYVSELPIVEFIDNSGGLFATKVDSIELQVIRQNRSYKELGKANLNVTVNSLELKNIKYTANSSEPSAVFNMAVDSLEIQPIFKKTTVTDLGTISTLQMDSLELFSAFNKGYANNDSLTVGINLSEISLHHKDVL